MASDASTHTGDKAKAADDIEQVEATSTRDDNPSPSDDSVRSYRSRVAHREQLAAMDDDSGPDEDNGDDRAPARSDSADAELRSMDRSNREIPSDRVSPRSDDPVVNSNGALGDLRTTHRSHLSQLAETGTSAGEWQPEHERPDRRTKSRDGSVMTTPHDTVEGQFDYGGDDPSDSTPTTERDSPAHDQVDRTTDPATGADGREHGRTEGFSPSPGEESELRQATEESGEMAEIRDPVDQSDRGAASLKPQTVDLTGKPRTEVEPHRYEVHSVDSEKLTDVVDSVGREKCGEWIGYVNPRYSTGGEKFQNNCGDCSRSFATTAQTDVSVAASGDSRLGEGREMWEWAGVRPANTLTETDSSKFDEFQSRAWKCVADQLDGEPTGTVAVVGVDWAPIEIGGVKIDQGGHWFNAHVSEDGIKWADAQTGSYKDWPPAYSSNVMTVESIYRKPGEEEWRA